MEEGRVESCGVMSGMYLMAGNGNNHQMNWARGAQ